MADPTGVVSDNYLAFGSQVVTINSVTYIADNIDYDIPVNTLTRRNEVNVPQAESQQVDVGTGSMTLQLATATTPAPTFGMATTIKDVDSTTFHVKTGKVGRKFTSNGETKLNVEIRQRFATGS